jgi:calcineurin-like phosphoesterase family protein
MMHNKIIDNYNMMVSNDDICYVLGDIAIVNNSNLNKLDKIINSLNGRKILILGNHDEGMPFRYLKMGFESVHTSLELNEWKLVHDPAWAIMQKNKTHIVGHVHSLFKIQGNCINVGIDVRNLFPVSLETLLEEEKGL